MRWSDTLSVTCKYCVFNFMKVLLRHNRSILWKKSENLIDDSKVLSHENIWKMIILCFCAFPCPLIQEFNSTIEWLSTLSKCISDLDWSSIYNGTWDVSFSFQFDQSFCKNLRTDSWDRSFDFIKILSSFWERFDDMKHPTLGKGIHESKNWTSFSWHSYFWVS